MDQPPCDSHRLADLTDIDLYCLQCGYNLRGLSGDPRRCPECGALNPIGPFMVPENMVREQLADMRQTPLICATVCLLGTLFGPPLLVAGVFLHSALLVIGLLFPAFWIHSLWKFRKAFGPIPGWKSAIVWFHINAVGTLLLVVLFGTLGLSLADWIGWLARKSLHLSESAANGATAVFCVLVIVAIGWTAHRALDRLQHMVDPLFRNEARRRAWEALAHAETGDDRTPGRGGGGRH